jgi:hypothetical protein
MIEYLVIGFIIGVIFQRIYSARHGGFTELGKSWELSNNKLYRKLHRFYCECCPRRHYCSKYSDIIKGENNNERR